MQIYLWKQRHGSQDFDALGKSLDKINSLHDFALMAPKSLAFLKLKKKIFKEFLILMLENGSYVGE